MFSYFGCRQHHNSLFASNLGSKKWCPPAEAKSRGVHPLESFAVTEASNEIKASTTSRLPAAAAYMSAVRPFLVWMSTLTSFCWSTIFTCYQRWCFDYWSLERPCYWDHATCSVEFTHVEATKALQPPLSTWLTSAPLFNSEESSFMLFDSAASTTSVSARSTQGNWVLSSGESENWNSVTRAQLQDWGNTLLWSDVLLWIERGNHDGELGRAFKGGVI